MLLTVCCSGSNPFQNGAGSTGRKLRYTFSTASTRRLNYRAGRASEIFSLSRDALTIRKVQPNGRSSEIFFNPYWVRLEVTEVEDEGVTKIEVRSRDEAVCVGAFLNPVDRRSFAHAFRAALAEAKSPGV